MTKAYSYLRFSTSEQMHGDSHRRQTQLARDYAIRHNLELDDELTFEDLGVSAYRQRNVETGRLGDFLEAVETGRVPQGSYLLVESLDRISRQSARKALRVLEDIVESGVTLVTLTDGREYTADALDNDPTALLISILIFMRANEESATKARRLRAAWANKREKAADQPMTSTCPAWMKRSGDTFALIPERAAVVRRIYDMYLSGTGQDSITKKLHEDGTMPFGKTDRWHRSYVSKILGNAGVVGTLVPHRVDYVDGRKTRVPLEPIEDYYPAVVDRDVFERVQAMRQHPGTRGRHARSEIRSILANLARCPECGSAMTRTSKGGRNRPKLVCMRAKTGAGCSYRSVWYADVEAAIVDRADDIIAHAPLGDAVEGLDAALDAVDAQISILEMGLDHLLDRVQAGEGTKLTMDRIIALEPDLEALYERQRSLMDQKKQAQSPLVAKRLEELRAALKADPLDRGAVNRLLRQVAAAVTVSWHEGTLVIHWRHGGETQVSFGWPGAG